MTDSALDRTCEKYGCAKRYLDPKLHEFDDCFGGRIRMGDIDAAVERNGHILWVEWKRGAVLEHFEKQFAAQWFQAVAFTKNNPNQTFVFVVGDPVTMTIEQFRPVSGGGWQYPSWFQGADRFKSFLRHWYSIADQSREAANA